MLPPTISNIKGEGLTLYTSRNVNESCESGGLLTRTTRARYAEIGVRRKNVFIEPYVQQHQFQHLHNHQQKQREYNNRSVQTVNLPNPPPPDPLQLDQFHHIQSEGSLISEGSGTSCGISSNSTTEENSGTVVVCNINLIERLIRSHPIWFLPGIQRAGAFHLLQGKEEGNFVVRQSSQSNTMALSVRLPACKGPYIEHYLIQANKGKLSLETSENRFDNIPSLIAHYSQCCDELPVQLILPRAMREAKNRQQLSSLALLGQEFWRYPMANPKLVKSGSSSNNTSSLISFYTGNNNNNDANNLNIPITESIILNLIPILIEDSPNTSPTNTVATLTFTTSGPRQLRPTPPNTLNLTTFNEPLDFKQKNKLSPNDKLSRLISPNIVTNLVRSSSSLVHNVEASALNHTNDLKNSHDLICESQFNSRNSLITSNFHQNIVTDFNNLAINTSPDIIQTPAEGNYFKSPPPPPPPRWAKPGQQMHGTTQNNFAVTTSVMFNVNQNFDISTIRSTTSHSKTFSLLSPQRVKSNKSLISNFSSNKSSLINSSSAMVSSIPILVSLSSKLKSNGVRASQVLSSTTPSSAGKSSKHRKERNARKYSQHYQESDITKSYYRSSPADKISDYEDIWNTTDQSNPSTWSPKNPILKGNIDKSKKHQPGDEIQNKSLSPIDSQYSSNKSNKSEQQQQIALTNDKLIIRNDKICMNEKLSYKEIIFPEFNSFKPFQDTKNVETTPYPDDIRVGNRPDLLSRVCSANSLNSTSTLTTPPNKFSLVHARAESSNSITLESKQGSSFYAEPADVVTQYSVGLVARRRPKLLSSTSNKFRHSEPGWPQTQLAANCNLGLTMLHPIDWDNAEEMEEKTPLILSSINNLAKRLSEKEQNKCLPCVTKSVKPLKIKPKVFNDTSWTIDSSWEFIGNDADDCQSECNCDADCDANDVGQKFPDEEHDKYIIRNTLTAQSIILQRYPELLTHLDTTKSLHSDRNSLYDKVQRKQERTCQMTNTMNTMITTTTTMMTMDPQRDQTYDHFHLETLLETDDDNDVNKIKRDQNFKERLDPVLSLPRLQTLRNRENADGSAIRAYVLQLAFDRTTTFSQNIENFIQCTKEGKEASPHVVMRNMRQFMSGMKNYLIKHGEREFEKEVERERLKLKPNEFLNLDAILEGAMMNLVVKPLREHVYMLFVEHFVANDSIQTLADSIQRAQSKKVQDLGVRSKIIPPTETNLNRILKYIERLQKVDSPFEKLQYLLAAISAIVNSVKHANSGRLVTLGADDLLPLLVWILVRGKVVDAEIEAEYMWGLLHPSLLSGEGGYYLTTLSSAVHVLKTFKSSQGTMSTINGSGTPDCSSVLRILIPDELHGSLNTRILPVRPNMNTRDLCRILAHKIRCTNPQDYGLFKLVQGEETLLGNHECPQEMSDCLFAYKRIDAKIAWPKTTKTVSRSSS